MALVHIIGCGETGAQWDGSGVSIGVNDCWKFGKPTQSLLVINRKTTFASPRLQTILDSKPLKFYSHLEEWRQHFPNAFTRISFTPWSNGKLLDQVLFHSKTSPFCAMSLAYNLGYKKIVLWGVDFVDHHIYSPGKPGFERERLTYMSFVRTLESAGIKVYAGCYGSTLGLPIYKKDEE